MTLTGAGTTGAGTILQNIAKCEPSNMRRGYVIGLLRWTELTILEGRALPTKNINVGSGPPLVD